mgnify:CR=1 FL=1
MITNQIMKRQLDNFTVEQRTKDAFFNASNLLKQWNSDENLNTQKNGDYKKKDIDDGFIKTPEDVANYLRRKFQQKYF